MTEDPVGAYVAKLEAALEHIMSLHPDQAQESKAIARVALRKAKHTIHPSWLNPPPKL